MAKINNKQSGFTLVELSIVLVIIGLIISSVLVGQDLIRSAELRATINQYESFNAAVGAFTGRYSGLPGDVDGETDFGFVGDGDGSGLLAASSHAANENVFFWNHLGSSGAALISGSYNGVAITNAATLAAGTPAAKAGQNWGVFTDGSFNYYILGVTVPSAGNNQTTVGMLSGLDALSIDDKVDDGRPGRGLVQARGTHESNANSMPGNTNCVSAFAGTDADIDNPRTPTAASTYSTTSAVQACTLRFRFQL